MTSIAAPVADTTNRVETQSAGLPWHVYAVLFASTSVVVGVIWDISWHRTIGRDTFLTPAHLAIYLGGVVAGLSCGWLVLRTSFAGSAADRAAGVSFWRFFRGPLGAWVAIWGAFAMITSAPFDDWWHNAYGLDVEIISPPHMVLALGIITIQIGAMLMVLAYQNRASSASPGSPGLRPGPGAAAAPSALSAPAAPFLYAYAAGLIVLMMATMTMEYTGFANRAHNALYYSVAGGVYPIVLVAAARASRLKWPATTAAAIYIAISLIMIWVLQLFPAQARLAPIYNPVTHMVPAPFPHLLIVPAFVLDLIMRRFGSRHDWILSLLAGAAFIGTFLAVQWFAAEFLLSPAARNFVFGVDQWDYSTRLGPWQYDFWALNRDAAGNWSPAAFARGIGIATLIAMASTRLGLWWGKWMEKVRR